METARIGMLILLNCSAKCIKDLPGSTQKFIWNVDDFNPPCQIISFVVKANKDLTYLWVRKDPYAQDLDIRCYGPITPRNFIETAELILTERSL